MTAAAPWRWEFRTWFAADAAPANPLGDWSFREASERTDVYLLLPDRPELLMKLRGPDRLEIKERIATDPPLEQWRVAFAADFPLEPARLAEAARLFAGPAARLDDEAGSDAESLIASLTSLAPRLTVCTVGKRRSSFEQAGIAGEWTEVDVAETGLSAVTIAMEAADPDALRAAIAVSGLADRPNRDYGARLRSADGPAEG